MTIVTQILFWLALASIIALCVILIVKKVLLTISQSRKLVEKALTKVLLKKCENHPNQLIVFKQGEDIIQVKFLPKQNK